MNTYLTVDEKDEKYIINVEKINDSKNYVNFQMIYA